MLCLTPLRGMCGGAGVVCVLIWIGRGRRTTGVGCSLLSAVIGNARRIQGCGGVSLALAGITVYMERSFQVVLQMMTSSP